MVVMKKVNGNNIGKFYCHSVYDFTKIDKYFIKYDCAHCERNEKLNIFVSLKNSFSLKKIYKKNVFNIMGLLSHHYRGQAPPCPLIKFSIRCLSCGKLYPLVRFFLFPFSWSSNSLDYINVKLNNLLKSGFFGGLDFFYLYGIV
jgi:hypothetical protein